ncbi:MAG TPA: hypothetical protein VIR02_13680 [Anaerolineales bacterium]
MSLPTIRGLERLLSRPTPKNNSQITILLIGGVILVLLFTLLVLALPALVETIEENSTLFLEMDISAWFTEASVAASLHLGLEMAVFFLIMRLEYLKGHIGEKRFDIARIQFNYPASQVRFFVATLFYRVAVFILSVRPGESTDPVFVRDQSKRSRAKKVNFNFIGGS